MTQDPSITFDVRVFGIKKYAGARRTSYIVRWEVSGRRQQRTFTTAKLADSFRAELISAQRSGRGFDTGSGLPFSSTTADPVAVSWFDFAMAYAQMKWASASPQHRRGIAEALMNVTVALVAEDASPIDAATVRRALTNWAFVNPPDPGSAPDEHAKAVAWLRRFSVAVAHLTEPEIARRALEALFRTLDGRPAASSTVTRKRATLNNALEYAVEVGHLADNPLRRIRMPLPRSDDAVDRRVVVNPAQARSLLGAVHDQDPALEGFFACLYYAGLRPAEVRNLRSTDCHLPETGWGRAVLTGSHQHSGRRWTDSGRAAEERSLKHRSLRATRPVPLHPHLVDILRRHIERFGTGADHRLFVARTGKAGVPLPPPYLSPVSDKTVHRAWQQARTTALTAEQAESVLARRPYDLRHACLSTWLNAGVPPAQVAEWAGHGIDVLLRVYAACVDGEEEASLRRIDLALGDQLDD